MDSELIDKYISTKVGKDEIVNIHFKDRSTVKGIFIRSTDRDELKAKNFWRIVNQKHVPLWEKTKDINLTRLFNGASFTRLTTSAN